MIVVYGVGKIGRAFLKRCSDACRRGGDIVACDSDQNLVGSIVEGYEIHNFEDIVRGGHIDKVIVATSDIYFEEIRDFVLSKVDVEVVPWHKCVVFINENDRINWGNVVLKHKLPAGIYSSKDLIDDFDPDSFNGFDQFLYEDEHNRVNKLVHYSEIYERHFNRFKGKDLKILEIGVFGGGSLQMWKTYFTSPGRNVRVYGIDINPECKKYEEEGIEIFIGSQEDRDFLGKVKEQAGSFDVIIDDGGHTMNQQICSFEELFGALSDDGVYLCEDIHTSYWSDWGGGYKKEGTFIEYCKNLVDNIHDQYIKDDAYENNGMTQVRSVSFYDSIVVIEKRSPVNRSIHLVVG